jgi:hypothetical protein
MSAPSSPAPTTIWFPAPNRARSSTRSPQYVAAQPSCRRFRRAAVTAYANQASGASCAHPVPGPRPCNAHRSATSGQPPSQPESGSRPSKTTAPRAFSLTPVSLSVTAGRVRTRRAAAPTFRGPAASRSPGRWVSPGPVPVPPVVRGLRAPRPAGARPRASAASRHPRRAPASHRARDHRVRQPDRSRSGNRRRPALQRQSAHMGADQKAPQIFQLSSLRLSAADAVP